MSKWVVVLHKDFDKEIDEMPAAVQDELYARAGLLEAFGPQLGRPHSDTLYGSKHANMKELRFDAGGGVWRVAFAFDKRRSAVLLVAGNKTGSGQKRLRHSSKPRTPALTVISKHSYQKKETNNGKDA